MEKLVNALSNLVGKGRTFKLLFNLSPMYRSTGGRIMEVSDDLRYVKLRLPLGYKTKNYVGTLYGGHMYSCIDGIYMVQLINILGKSYVVWDKSAYIKFKRPGTQTLYAEFDLSGELLEQIKIEINKSGEKDFNLSIALKDQEGIVYAEIEKTIYIASKEYYRKKRSKERHQSNAKQLS